MSDVSDSGAVAARVGFKFQDHVAAYFVLQMIGDRRIVQVECETSDDITLIWNRNGLEFPEYVQVKTTDKDSKWSFVELVARGSDKKSANSIAEKSLLADKHGDGAVFRFVARRALNKSLAALMIPISHRNDDEQIKSISEKFRKKYPKTTSLRNHDLAYWAQNLFWDVQPGIDSVEVKNLQALSRIAEDSGANPTASHAKTIYLDLLRIVEAAANATRRSPKEKTIRRSQALDWWQAHLDQTHAAQAKTSKPYRTKGERFFLEIHNLENGPKQSSSGYDARFERRIWRSRQLARHLADWIPEVTLRASELVEVDQLNMRSKLEAGLREIQAHREVDAQALMGETLLHAVLRHWFGSEPIGCKLFHRSRFGEKITRNAHLVHTREGDQLWLGRVHYFDGENLDEFFRTILSELREALETELLVEERAIILELREPQHYTNNELGEALVPGAPIDAFIEILCLPILMAYDSEILSQGYVEDYQEKLSEEIAGLAERFFSGGRSEISEVRVHIFLVPIERLSELQSYFENELGLA